MKSYSLAVAALIAACPLAARAQAVPAASAAPVTLRLKFTPGQTLYYNLTTDSNGLVSIGQSGAGIPIKDHVEMLIHQTVKDVRAKDGAATLESGVDTLKMTMGGKEFPTPPNELAVRKVVGTTVILPTGKTLSFTPDLALSGASAPGLDSSQANAFSILGQLPDAPVKVGDTWKSVGTAGLAYGRIVSNFALARVDTGGGKTIAVISLTMNGTLHHPTHTGKADPAGNAVRNGLDKISGIGVLRFDVHAGSLESVSSRMDILEVGGKGPTEGVESRSRISTTMKRADAPAHAANPVPR